MIKINKTIVIAILLLTFLCSGIPAAYAGVTDGTSYTSYTFTEVPAWGGTKYNTTNGSRKTDNTSKGTFKTTDNQIFTAPYCRFMTKNKENRLTVSSVPYGIHVHELYSSVSKGDVLYTKVSSSTIEPGNITIKLYHSANDLLN